MGFKCPPNGDKDVCIPSGFHLTPAGVYTDVLICDPIIPVSKRYHEYWGQQIHLRAYKNNDWVTLPPLPLSNLYDPKEFTNFLVKNQIRVLEIFPTIVWCEAFLYHNRR